MSSRLLVRSRSQSEAFVSLDTLSWRFSFLARISAEIELTSDLSLHDSLAKEFGQSGMTALSSYARGDYGGVLSSLTSFAHHATNDNRILQQNRVTKTSEADVISFSGCKDSQTSADAADDFGRASGAMSWAFVAALSTIFLFFPSIV